MANTIDEQIEVQKRLYNLLPENDPTRSIISGYIEKLKMEKSKLDFVRHVYDTCLSCTNKDLDKENMQDLSYYSQHKDLYLDEFQFALRLFEKHLHELMSKIERDLILGFKRGVIS